LGEKENSLGKEQYAKLRLQMDANGVGANRREPVPAGKRACSGFKKTIYLAS